MPLPLKRFNAIIGRCHLNFSNSYVGEGKVRRGTEDLKAAGMTLEGTSNVTVSGNLFASVKPKAVEAKGEPSRGILFADNVLVDVESDHDKLQQSQIEGNLKVPSTE